MVVQNVIETGQSDALAAEMAQLIDAQLIRALAEEELTYLFKHALTQATVYDSLLVKKRRAIHYRVAEVIARLNGAQLDEYAALLAYHYAEAADDAKTVAYSLRAAQVSMRVYAYPE